jgi:hypothetical protein
MPDQGDDGAGKIIPAPGPGGDNSNFPSQVARAALGVAPLGQIARTVRRAFGGPKQPEDIAD